MWYFMNLVLTVILILKKVVFYKKFIQCLYQLNRKIKEVDFAKKKVYVGQNTRDKFFPHKVLTIMSIKLNAHWIWSSSVDILCPLLNICLLWIVIPFLTVLSTLNPFVLEVEGNLLRILTHLNTSHIPSFSLVSWLLILSEGNALDGS